MKKRLLIIIIILVSVFFLSINRVLAKNSLCEIKSYNENKYCVDKNGANYIGFQVVNGNTYFFGRMNGAMKTGMFLVDGDYYYFDETTGVMQTGIKDINGNKYYFGADGKMQTGFQEINGSTYFFGRMNGAMKTGMFLVDGDYYYFNETTGMMQTGIKDINGNKYYFGADGKMQTGFQEINGSTYFFGRMNGVMKTGMFLVDGDYYYFDETTGMMQTGIKDINGNKYYFGADGKMQTGFQEINGSTYFFGRMNGTMKTGMFLVDGDYYYFDETTGVMQTGIVKINGKNYFFDSEGKRNFGFQTVDNYVYFFSRIGNNEMKYGWQNINSYFYYFDKYTGIMNSSKKNIDGIEYDFRTDGVVKLTGWNNINGNRYYFNAGYKILGNVEKIVIDVSKHQGDINWDLVQKSGKVYGVILRVGSWNNEDSKFKEYISEIKRLGIPYGIYLFSYASTINGTNIEANFTNQMISKYNLNPTLGIYYDLEDWYISADNTSNVLTANDYDNIAWTYLNSVRTYTGNKYKVKIYANLNYANNRFNDYARNEIDWIAQYNSFCSYTGNYSMWQFTSSGTIDGINGYVDMSYLYR